MKKTILTITRITFAALALLILAVGANAETYQVKQGGKLSFTNAPTSQAGSSAKLITIKNDRKSAVGSSKSTAAKGSKSGSAIQTEKKSGQQENDQKQTDETKAKQDRENGEGERPLILDAPN